MFNQSGNFKPDRWIACHTRDSDTIHYRSVFLVTQRQTYNTTVEESGCTYTEIIFIRIID